MKKSHPGPCNERASKYPIPLHQIRTIVPVMLLLIILLFAFTAPARADAFIVDRFDDDPAFSACTSNPSDCSLRGAIIAANNNGSSHDTITLPSGTFILSLPGTGEDDALDGDLDILTDLTLQGDGVNSTIIDGNQSVVNEVIFHVLRFKQVEFRNITIQNGNGAIYSLSSLDLLDCQIKDNNTSSRGGAVWIGSSTNLNINNCMISNNTAAINGGGISANNSQVTITNSTIKENHALGSGSGGGIWTYTEYFLPPSSLIIEDSIISDNTAGVNGGAISSTTVPMSLSHVTVGGNEATTGDGGAIYFEAFYPIELGVPILISVEDSDFKDNIAAASGGGIYMANLTVANIYRTTIRSNTANGSLALEGGGGIYGPEIFMINSTISGNQANGDGGGFYGAFSFKNVTITSNTADADESGGHEGGGIYGSGYAWNTIIANNSGDQCAGSFLSCGSNISSDGTCNLTEPDDQPNTNPLLGPLSDNGGLTPTHALLLGSPAIDTASTYKECPSTDQRGITRPQGSGCDIGAFEQDLLKHLFLPLILK